MSSKLPPIRVVHHWACSGGTIISRSLAQLPNVVLLSEVHPLAHLRLHAPSSGYQPTDVVQQLSLAHNGRDPVLCMAAWQGSILALQAAVSQQNQVLVLRSHSHIDFFCGGLAAEETLVSRSLRPKAALLELLTVRHPLDSWLSILNNQWHLHFAGADLESFCRRALRMLEACQAMPWLRYEDFSLRPAAALEAMANVLQLDPVTSNLSDQGIQAIQLSGDSGRRADVISARPRRPIPETQQRAVDQALDPDTDSSYLKLCHRLGYDPDPKAAHPFLIPRAELPHRIEL